MGGVEWTDGWEEDGEDEGDNPPQSHYNGHGERGREDKIELRKRERHNTAREQMRGSMLQVTRRSEEGLREGAVVVSAVWMLGTVVC